ncbi:MAG: hypothetical protein HKN13_01520 [Rhodothermales bacterium]|nr:hypothetical protein [Rhodothermales bacterium]
MARSFHLRLVWLASAIIFLSGTALAQEEKEAHRVFEYVVESASGDVDAIATSIKTAALQSGWETLTTISSGVPDGCSYDNRVLILHGPAFADKLMDANRTTAPFALVDRINIFEDENGTHVSVVNPQSIMRTVLMDDPAYEQLAATHLQDLRAMILSAVEGDESDRAYGQRRKRGHIGKTMGVMAGGKFSKKIQDKVVVPGGDLNDVVLKVREGLSVDGPKWGLKLAYELPMPKYDVVVFGTTSPAMESKSFSIVKAGSDKARKAYSCPGLAHAGAYPLEVVVTKTGEDVHVQFVDAMYRMKMYFEDAGKMAFMKNMTMPGSLADELRDQIRSRFDEFSQ